MPGEAEVGDLERVEVCGEQHVAGLEVAVHYHAAVHEVDGLDQLAEEGFDARRGNESLLFLGLTDESPEVHVHGLEHEHGAAGWVRTDREPLETKPKSSIRTMRSWRSFPRKEISFRTQNRKRLFSA